MTNPVWLQHTITGDLNGDGALRVADLLVMIANWGECNNCIADLNHDEVVDVSDLLTLISLG